MSLLIETIRISRRRICHVTYHNRRFNNTRKQLFGMNDYLDLARLVRIPAGLGQGIYKCRISYDVIIRCIEFIPYSPKQVRNLRLVRSDDIEYSYKYADRTELHSLLDRQAGYDDILIVKNGFVTDSSYSNVLFLRPDGQWITPDTPLLKGTMRQFLLDKGIISEQPVHPRDIKRYVKARLINCMMGMEQACDIETEQIFLTADL